MSRFVPALVLVLELFLSSFTDRRRSCYSQSQQVGHVLFKYLFPLLKDTTQRVVHVYLFEIVTPAGSFRRIPRSNHVL